MLGGKWAIAEFMIFRCLQIDNPKEMYYLIKSLSDEDKWLMLRSIPTFEAKLNGMTNYLKDMGIYYEKKNLKDDSN